MRIFSALLIALLLNLEFCFAQQVLSEQTLQALGPRPPLGPRPLPAIPTTPVEGVIAEEANAGERGKEMNEWQKVLLENKELCLKAGLEVVDAFQARYEQGLDNVEFLLKAQERVALSATELLEGDELISALRYARELTRFTLLRNLELQKVGMRGGDAASVVSAKYAMLEAEIRLLRELRKQGKN